jgi:hypothetical protein
MRLLVAWSCPHEALAAFALPSEKPAIPWASGAEIGPWVRRVRLMCSFVPCTCRGIEADPGAGPHARLPSSRKRHCGHTRRGGT